MSPSRSTTRNRISLASGAGSKSSPVGLIGAVALHLAVIAVTLFTWEHRLDIAQPGKTRLIDKPFALHDGINEFGIGGGRFDPADVEIPLLGEPRCITMGPGQRRRAAKLARV